MPTSTPVPTATLVPTTTLVPTEAPSGPADGETIYNTSCASCHSMGGAASVSLGLGNIYNQDELAAGVPFSEEALSKIILKGAGQGGSAPCRPSNSQRPN